MTEEQEPIDVQDDDVLNRHVYVTQEIGQALYDKLPPDFVSARLECHMIWQVVSVLASYNTLRGKRVKFVPPPQIFDQLAELREATYAQDKGAWYIARFHITNDGDLTVEYDYDAMPKLPQAKNPDDYLKDLERYPRSDDLKPGWLRPSGGGGWTPPTRSK